MSFKKTVNADNVRVFLNPDEFAEEHDIIYDGVTYHAPIVMIKNLTDERQIESYDHAQGIYSRKTTVYIAAQHMDGMIPERGKQIAIDDGVALDAAFYQRYSIIEADNEMGIVRLNLEAFDE